MGMSERGLCSVGPSPLAHESMSGNPLGMETVVKNLFMFPWLRCHDHDQPLSRGMNESLVEERRKSIRFLATWAFPNSSEGENQIYQA